MHVTPAVTNRRRCPHILTDRDVNFEKETRERPMSTIKLIVSDLHVASGDTMLDGFGERQQASLEGLLAAADRSGDSPLVVADEVELILNGDCLDFLIVEPHDTGGVMHADLAVEQLRKMTAAHGPFFETLGRF